MTALTKNFASCVPYSVTLVEPVDPRLDISISLTAGTEMETADEILPLPDPKVKTSLVLTGNDCTFLQHSEESECHDVLSQDVSPILKIAVASILVNPVPNTVNTVAPVIARLALLQALNEARDVLNAWEWLPMRYPLVNSNLMDTRSLTPILHCKEESDFHKVFWQEVRETMIAIVESIKPILEPSKCIDKDPDTTLFDWCKELSVLHSVEIRFVMVPDRTPTVTTLSRLPTTACPDWLSRDVSEIQCDCWVAVWPRNPLEVKHPTAILDP
jgi:hypothetical protein